MTLATHANPRSLSQPILRIGMYGFTAERRRAMEASLKRPGGLPVWRIGDFSDADAWWVNGANVRVLPDGNLRVLAGLPTERALKLNLSEVDRPIAFTRPLSSGNFEPLCSFDPASEPSISRVLLNFDTFLRTVRTQFVLGAKVLEHGSALRDRVCHVSHQAKLVAVLNFRNGKAGLSPHLHPADLLKARWESRPAGAGQAPHDFLPVTVRQLSWIYASRTDFKMLPSAYRTGTIYYRQVPRVPLSWVRDSQFLILRELLSEPATLQSLRQRTGLTHEQLEHDLTCLCCAGAITTTRAKATGPITDRSDTERHSSGSDMASSWPLHADLSAPALLEPKPPVRAINGIAYFEKQQPASSAEIQRLHQSKGERPSGGDIYCPHAGGGCMLAPTRTRKSESTFTVR